MKKIRMKLIFGISLISIMVLVAGVAGSTEEPPLSNADIIKLTKLAMGDQVIITKIKTAKSVKFDTSTDDLAKLKDAGVSGPVIAAMMERSASATVLGSAPKKGTITLIAKEGTFDIKPISGQFKSVTVPVFGFRRFVEFSPNATAVRVKDHSPALLLNADGDPREAVWLVRLVPWNNLLVVDLLSPSIWVGGATSNDPDESFIIPYNANEEKPGLWRITPKGELKPGDYGLFRWAPHNPTMPLLVGFGIDK